MEKAEVTDNWNIEAYFAELMRQAHLAAFLNLAATMEEWNKRYRQTEADKMRDVQREAAYQQVCRHFEARNGGFADN